MARASSRATARRPRVAVILAAGRGVRMRSERPKVLHRAGGRPLVTWVVEAALRSGCREIFVVVPPDGDEIRCSLNEEGLLSEGNAGGVEGQAELVVQAQPRGTGHALLQAAQPVTEALEPGEQATLLVLSGDTPLLTAETLQHLAAASEGSWGAIAVAELEYPGALGRVLTREDGSLDRIVEASDATEEELEVRRVNAGIYALPVPEVFEELERLEPDNAQGEIYLTDAPGAAAARGERVMLWTLDDPTEAFGVNTRAELARAHRRLLDRHLEGLMAEGVTVLEPTRTSVEPSVRVGPDTVIHPGVSLSGRSEVGPGAVLHQGAWIRNSRLGAGVTVGPYAVLEGVEIEAGEHVAALTRLTAAGNKVAKNVAAH